MYKHLGSKQRKVWTIAMLILVIVPMTWSVPGLHQLNAMEDDAEVESNKSAKEIATKEQEILALNARIEELKKQKSTATIDAAIIAEQLNKIKREVERAQLELNRTKGAINKIAEESVTTEDEIAIIKEKLVETRLRLRHIIRTLYIREQESLITVWLVSGSLGDLLSARSALQELQNQSVILVGDLREQQIILEQKQKELEQQEKDLGQLASLLSRQNEDLAAQRAEQNKFLSAKEEEKIQYERRIIEARQAREEIEQDIFSLKGSGIKVSLTDANDMARFASSLTGVRAALILAVLKVESNIGKSVGTGSFPDDMHPASREPFLRLTATLGIDPYTTAVAARPKNLKGWGGAMGPAQIMPQTWEGMSPRLAKLMGKAVPNPFELSDAMVATAVFLADRGATSAGGEREAVLRYIAGPNWQYYSWYGDRVLAVAAEYAKEGL